jgi:hypothetical protein
MEPNKKNYILTTLKEISQCQKILWRFYKIVIQVWNHANYIYVKIVHYN